MTEEKINDYAQDGEKLFIQIKETLATALLAERRKRNLKLSILSRRLGITEDKIEAVELAYGKIRWARIALLLKFYGKGVHIEIVDIPQNAKAAPESPAAA